MLTFVLCAAAFVGGMFVGAYNNPLVKQIGADLNRAVLALEHLVVHAHTLATPPQGSDSTLVP